MPRITFYSTPVFSNLISTSEYVYLWKPSLNVESFCEGANDSMLSLFIYSPLIRLSSRVYIVLACRTDSPSSQAVIPLVHATSMMTWCDIEYNDYFSITSICLGGGVIGDQPPRKQSFLINIIFD